MSRAKRQRCDWCRKPAVFEHVHVLGRAELACADHHGGCTRCQPLGHADKYADKARRADPR